MNKLFIMVLFATTLGIFSGCGDTTGIGGTKQPTKVVIKVSTKGPLVSGTQIGGVDMSVKLPPGVTAKSANGASLETASGVIEASGVATSNSTIIGTYTNQTGLSSGGTVRILLANSSGFPAGEFATINADIIGGSVPGFADFNKITAVFKDLNGIDINGLAADYSIVFN